MTSINHQAKKRPKTFGNIWCSSTKTTQQNNFKVATTPDATTLEYYQSIYTHCKQRFNISDGIEVVKKSVYQYIENHINNYFFGNYNILEVRSNFYNNLVHYSQLETEDLNSKTLATYFQELNFNIIKYCEETYPVQFQYSIDFESETETSNKSKQKLKQYSKTTPNILILPKTTAKHLQTPEQRTSSKLPLIITPFSTSLAQAQTPNSPLNRFARLKDFTSPRSPTRQQELLQTSSNLLDFLAENRSKHSKTAVNEENNSEISEEESINSENKKDKMTAYIAKIPEFNGENIKTSPQEWLDQITKAGDANGWNTARMLKTISYFFKGTTGKWFENLTTSFNDWTVFKTAFLEQFTDNNTSITLRNCFRNIKQEPFESNKLIKKVHPHAPENLNSAIQHAKRYEMAIEEANHTKLVNLVIGETSSAAEEKIDQLAKKVENYFTNQQQQQPQRYQPPQRWNQNNFTSPSNNQPQSCHYSYYLPRPQYQSNYYQPASQPIQQQYQQPPTQHYQFSEIQLNQNPPIIILNLAILQYLNNRIFTILHFRKIELQHDNKTLPILLPQSHQPELLKTPTFQTYSLLSLKQITITAMYTEAEVEGKAIYLILDSRSAGNILTYQLMQQLKRNVDQPAQTVIITADGMKKTPVGEIDNFLFTLDGITIPVKVLVMNTPQYQALVRNDWLQKANANLNWETQELTIFYQRQYAQVSATCGTFNKCSEKVPAFEFEPEEKKPIIKTFMTLGSTSNWADETEQQYFSTNDSLETKKPVTTRWNVPYSKPKPQKQHLYIPLKCKDCHKKLSSMGTCQYALSISEKVKKETPFNAAYNSALNKLYYYPHNAKMIFDLAMALINGAIKEDVHQMKEAEYIEYTIELAGFDYKDEVEQINIRLCDEQWCPECYALCIPLPSKNNENKIEFGEPEATEEIEATPIYLIENQYPDKDTLVLKPKSLTKINLKIALEIPPGAIVQIASQSSLASKEINVREEIINAGYTGDITIILQNKTDKLFKIEHAKKIAQTIYLSLINISGLQLVNQRELLGKNERGTQGFGSTGRFTVPVNIALNEQKKSHQILRLPQPITISSFGEHPEIYTCEKPTTTQQIFESNKQICLEYNISIPNIYIPEETKKI
ncbi:hypothetical protein G9A89_006340 [Geosiphon pyriformis]|nr:hypothetical protein G9A89_006340 [Geosiphon pyriformis]